MSWTHQFDEDFAVEHGLHEAIVFEKIRQWVRHNAANDKNLNNGRYWTFNSVKAWQKQLPFLTEKQIRTALETLRTRGFLLTGHFSGNHFDRAMWYTLSDYALALEGKSDLPHKASGVADQGKTSTTTTPQDNEIQTHAVAIAPARGKKRDPLWKDIADYIVARGGSWAAGAKEAVSLDRLVAWAKKEQPARWNEYLQAVLDGAWELVQGKAMLPAKDKEWWKRQPYTPSSLLSLAPRIVAVLKTARGPIDAEAYAEAALDAARARRKAGVVA